MHEISSHYRREGDAILIEIRLANVMQLFNSLDPSPFHEKDLDREAEEYLVGAVREFHLRDRLKLVIHLADAAHLHAASIPEAIHHYFAYRAEVARRDLRFLWVNGRVSLAIGATFLAACLALRGLVPFEGTPGRIFAEGLLIVGWVAMWRPLQIFLYDWWPQRHRARVYEKIAAMPVEVRAIDQPGP